MKKFLWFSFLLGLIFLGWCTTTNKLSQNELFQKKQECASYKTEIEKEIKERNFINGIWWGQTQLLESIFYSRKNNTCMYHVRWSISYMIDWALQVRDTQSVYDYFSKEKIISTPTSCKNYDGENIPYIEWACIEDNFNIQLEGLKWE